MQELAFPIAFQRMRTSILFAALAVLPHIHALSETLFTDGFENFDQTKTAAYLELNPDRTKLIEGEEALSGNVSAELDTRKDKSPFPLSLKISHPEMLPGFQYRLSMRYFAPKSRDGSAPRYYVYMERKPSPPENRDPAIGALNNTYSFFGSDAPQTFCGTFVPAADGDSPYICLTSAGGARIIVDDIKLEKSPLQKCVWMLEKDAFLFLRIPPTGGYYYNESEAMFEISKKDFFPFIDKYGQFKHKSWPNKITADSDFKKMLEAELAFNSKLGGVKNRDKYFGLVAKDRKFNATGRFRLQKVDGKWFFITPEGNLFWSHGIDCVGGAPSTPTSKREHYFEDISDSKYSETGWWAKVFYEPGKFKTFNFTARNIDLKYADKAPDYKNVAPARLKTWGINTYGAWTQTDLLKAEKIPYALILSSIHPLKLESKNKLYGYWKPFPDYFDPRFGEMTKKAVLKSADLIRSPYCIGVFIDNELPWQSKTISTPKAVLTCPADQPSKVEFKKFLQKKRKNIENLNNAWASEYKDWNEFLSRTDFVPKTGEGKRDMLEFEREIYRHYFKTCRDAVKNADPEALYFGCRLAWTNVLVEKVASTYCDAVSFNLYRDSVADFDLPEGAKDKPVIIGEFHFGNQDRGVFGGGLRPCATMAERVKKYETYLDGAIKNPRIVGAHWFQYFDQPTTGRCGDGENYSVGFVDVADTPQYEMVEAARKFSEEMYEKRLSGNRSSSIENSKR